MTSDNQIYIPLCIYFNPEFFVAAPPSKLHLHSTMYLFQLLLAGLFPILLIFTFHYVSISTDYTLVYTNDKNLFTFHYVSISTLQSSMIDNNVSLIYIPLCIYFNLSTTKFTYY